MSTKSAVVGALRVNLGLDSAEFSSGLDRSLEKAKGFSKGVGVAMAAAAAAAAAGLAGLVHHGLEFIDQQAKTARSMDGTINGLRALQRAGEDAGVPQDMLVAAMQRMGQALGQAEMGYGTASYALKALGLKASDLMKMDVDTRLATIADKMHKLGLSAQEASGIMGVLGIRSKQMALLMTQGGDAIRAARKEIVDLGLAMSATDAKKVEEANDAMSRMSSVTEMVSNRLTIALAPALKAMADWFTALSRTGGALREVIDFLGQHLGELGAIAGTFAAVMGARMVAAMVGVRAGISGVVISLDALKGAIVRTGIGLLIVGLGEAIYWFARLDSGAGGFGKALHLLGNVVTEVFARGGMAATAFGQMAEGAFLSLEATGLKALQRVSDAMTGGVRWAIAFSAAALDDQKRGIQYWMGQIKSDLGSVHSSYGDPAATDAKANAAFGRATKAWQGATAPLKSVTPLMTAIKGSSDSAGSSLKESAAAAKDLGSGLQMTATKGSKALNEAQKAAKSLTSTVKSDFQGLVTGTETWRQALGNVLSKLAEIAASDAFSAFTGGKGGWFDSLVSGLFGAGSATKISANADGTTDFAGGLTKLHERGDEIALMPKGSAVLTHDQSQRLLKGASGAAPAAVEIHLKSDMLDARIASGSAGQAVRVLQSYDQALPRRVAQISADPSFR